MARLATVALALLVLVCAAHAQQLVTCTYAASGRISRTLSGASFSRAGVDKCWELDNLNDPLLESSEQQAPATPVIRIEDPGDAGAQGGLTKAATVCASSVSIYGGVREVKLTGSAAGCTVETRVSQGAYSFSSGADECPGTGFYRLDGTGTCASGVGSPGAYSNDFDLASKGGKSLNALGDAFEITMGSDLPTVATIKVFGSSAGQVAQVSVNIAGNTGDKTSAINYVIQFSEFTGDQSVFANTGAIEFSFGEKNRDSFVFFFDVIPLASTSVSARVFQDCGCNGFDGTDSLRSGQAVTLTVGGTGATCTGTQTLNTDANGAVTFGNLPSGCSFTVSTTGLTLCSATPSSQTVTGGTVNFAIQGTNSNLQIPADKVVICGGCTDATATCAGIASSTGGSCGTAGTGSPTFSDQTTTATCTPGGTIRTIRRTWSLTGVPSQTQTITVTDPRQAPSFANFPSDTSISCNQALPSSSGVTATGSCGPATVTSADTTGVSACNAQTCTSTTVVTRTFTATDGCGNTATRSQTITRTGCSPACATPPPTPNSPPPPPADLPTNANCRFICDDDDSSAASIAVSVLLVALLAVVALF